MLSWLFGSTPCHACVVALPLEFQQNGLNSTPQCRLQLSHGYEATYKPSCTILATGSVPPTTDTGFIRTRDTCTPCLFIYTAFSKCRQLNVSLHEAEAPPVFSSLAVSKLLRRRAIKLHGCIREIFAQATSTETSGFAQSPTTLLQQRQV